MRQDSDSNEPGVHRARSVLIKSVGPWPFTTQRVYQRYDHSLAVWRSRNHRKGLLVSVPGKTVRIGLLLQRCLWMPQQLNWWIGIVFAVGASLFMLGSMLSLAPTLARDWSLSPNAVSAVFFAGSIPFTIAAYLQLFQAANAGKSSPHGRTAARQSIVIFGWRPHNIGWLSCALQFLGTILFNFNTFDAMLSGLNWRQQDWDIWAPDFIGSVLFLLSGYLAFIETCHAHWAWKPTSLSWWVTFVNLLGCVGFMIAAVFAFVPPHSPSFDAVTISLVFTLIGAIGFLIGSLLLLPETILPADDA